MKILKILLLLCLCSYNIYAQTNQSCNDFLYNDLKNKQLNQIALSPTEKLYLTSRNNECLNNLEFDTRIQPFSVLSNCKDIRFLKIHYKVLNNIQITSEDNEYYNINYEKNMELFSNDYILPHNGPITTTKILKIDSNSLYVRNLNENNFKSIRKIPLNIIDKYEFNSQYNSTIRRNDSILLNKYYVNNNLNINQSFKAVDNSPIDLKTSNISSNNNGNSTLAVAGAFILVSGIMKIVNNNLNAPSIDEFNNPEDFAKASDDWAKKVKLIDNISNGMLGIGGFTLVIASVKF